MSSHSDTTVEKSEASDLIQRARRHERQIEALRTRISAIGRTGRVITTVDSDPARAAVAAVSAAVGAGEPPVLAPGGSSRYRVAALLRSVGIVARLVRADEGWSTRLDGPVIGFHGPDRIPTAITSTRHGPVRMDDGAAVDEAEFARRIMVIHRGIGRDPVTLKGLYGRLGSGISSRIAVGLLGVVVAGVLGLILPISAQVLFSDIVPFGQTGRLAVLAPLLVAITVAIAAFTWWAQRQVMIGRTLIDRRLAVAVWDRVLTLPVSFFSGRSVSEVSAMVHAPGRMHRAVPDAVMITGVAGVIGLVNLAFIARQGVALAALTLGAAAIVLGAIIRVNLGARRHLEALVAARVRTQGFLRQTVTAVSKLRVSASEERLVAHWARLLVDQQSHAAALMTRDLRLRLAVSLLPMVGALALVLSAPSQASDAGTFVAMYVALNQAVAATAAIGSSWSTAVRAAPMLAQLSPVLEASPETPPTPRPPLELTGRIEVDGLTFGYGADRPPVFDDLSFTIDAGSMVALVGPSGAGKSTLLRLLLGFEQPQAGVIRYDGQPIGELDLTDLRRQIGVVLQQARLLPGSIRTNIAAGRPLDDGQIWEIAERASLGDDIRAMPMGLETIVNEGANTLSGGQRQRVIIARALAGDPALMFFDEATSALDNISQAKVSEGLDRMDITRLVIAHRLSTIRHADQIFVLWDGRIAERGTYNELMELDGRFAELASRQLA